MNILNQERTSPGQVFPYPTRGERVEETPPSFCWLRADGIDRYSVQIRDDRGRIIWTGETDKNYIVPDSVLEPGHYEWNVSGGGMEKGWWDFEIAPWAVRLLRPVAREVMASVPLVHPRHLFFAGDVEKIKGEKAAELETLKRNIKAALDHGIPEAPRFHTDADALPFREYFGRHREFCDRDLVASALGHALLGDRQAGEHAVRSLLTICGWNPAGPCSVLGPWGDEVGLSHARCLPAVYDLVWDLLSDGQREYVEQTIAAYAAQCEERLKQLDFGQNPGDSHAGRVPAYLGEAALVLKGGCVAQETLERWLGLALDIFSSFYPHFGGRDGGWAEGTFYATSYTKWYLPFFLAVERYSGFGYLNRPFYQRAVHFFLHFAPPGWESHPFGDGYWCQSDSAEWPGFFAQNPFRIYAERSGLDLACRWSRSLASPEIFKLHLLDVFIPSAGTADRTLVGDVTRTRSFPDTGFISLHTHLDDPGSDLALIARASRYGTASHQHADQGSFALVYKGTTLISPSGYYGRGWGTRHHIEWTRQTKAHNVVLIDGVGQEALSHRATGKVLSCGERDGALCGELDLSAAYPMLTSYRRRFVLLEKGILIVNDCITAEKPVTVSWLLHSLSLPHAIGKGVTELERNGIRLTIRPVSGGLGESRITDRYDVDLNEGVPEPYQAQMPPQYHMSWQTQPHCVHDITVAFCIDGTPVDPADLCLP